MSPATTQTPGRSALTADRRALLALRAMQRGGPPRPAPIPRVERTPEGLALSPAQERLWFLTQLEPDAATYNLPTAVALRGAVDVGAVQAAVDGLVARHEPLRTTVEERDGRGVQVIHDRLAVPVHVTDLTALGAEAQAAAVAAAERAAAAHVFRLDRDAPLRVEVLRLADDTHRLLLTVHHIASDAWSMGVMVDEFTALYAAAVAGAPPPALAPLAVQYADVAAWQRAWLDGPEAASERTYWEEALAGAPSLLALPADRPRPPAQQFDGDWVDVDLSARTTAAVTACAAEAGTTAFVVLLAAFSALLSRYARQDDVCIGTPTAGRLRAETEPLVGMFVNTLVVRSAVDRGGSFRDHLAHTRERVLGAQAHQALSFEQLLDVLRPERDPSRHPLFQVMFSFGKMTMGGLQNGGGDRLGLDAEQRALSSGTSKFDLTLMFAESRERLRGVAEFSTALFDRATIEHLLRAYVALLEDALAHPDTPVGALAMVDAPARAALRGPLAGTAADVPETSLGELFEAQAAATPDRVALLTEPGHALTYAALDRAAERVASALDAHGIRPGACVGLSTARDARLVAGLLGIAKTGAAYVPLDPAYPADRRAVMLADAAPDAIVLSRETADTAPGLPTVLVEDALAAPDRPAPDRPRPAADDLAYVVYTSGSTGRPKGVALTQSGIVNELTWRLRSFPLDAGAGVLHNFSYSFDPSVWMFFWPWLAGGHVVLMDEDALADVPHLAGALARHRTAVVGGAPSLLEVLVREPAVAQAQALRHVFSGGEPLHADLADRFRVLPGATLHNVYGPTETVIDATWYATDADRDRGAVPIGHAVTNKRTYVLDDRLALVPQGMAGELCVGGAGLARGYLGRPALTAATFVPDPYGRAPGRRLYRTGDLTRRRADGAIEFLGRVDEQVKLRGFRIEPDGVAAVLSEHPAVCEAVVVVREDGGRRSLVGYAVPEAEAPAPADLRAFLKARLPEYMVPQRLVVLADLPRGPGGKVDRKALPAPPADRSDATRPYAAPETPAEAVLCRVWADLLGLDRVGRDDNFFELGGDSILSLQVLARARAEGVRLTARQMFQHPTVAALADAAEVDAAATVDAGPFVGPLALTPGQQRALALDGLRPHVFSAFLETPVGFDRRALGKAVARLVDHHDALRAQIVFENGAWRQTIAAPGADACTLLDLSAVPPADRADRLAAEAAAAKAEIDLTTGPLFRAVHADLGADVPGRLLLVVHRLVTDGPSWAILQADLQAFYAEAARGDARPLPRTAPVAAWADALADAPADASYYTDRVGRGLPTPAPGTVADARPHTRALSPDRTFAVLRLATSAYRVGVAEVIEAALAQGLAAWQGPGEAWVGRETDGREHTPDLDLTRTVGFLTLAAPVLVDATAGPPHEALAAAHHRERPDAAAAPPDAPTPLVALRYLGDLGDLGRTGVAAGPFSDATEDTAPDRPLDAPRAAWATLDAYVLDGALRLDWTTGPAAARPAEALVDAVADALAAIADHAQTDDAGLPPDAFTHRALPSADLDRIAELLAL